MTDLTALADALRGLLGPGFGIGVTDPRAQNGALWPEEAPAIAKAVPKRQLEFTAGRAAARLAMAELGLGAQPIPMAPDRAPIWPTGLVGSITHCDTAAIAAVARTNHIRAIGIDIEPATPMDPDLWDTVCTGTELEWLNTQPQSDRGLQAKLIFSAKESVYKCQYPVKRAVFGFDKVTIALNLSEQTFVAMIRNSFEFTGRFHLDIGVLICTVTLE